MPGQIHASETDAALLIWRDGTGDAAAEVLWCDAALHPWLTAEGAGWAQGLATMAAEGPLTAEIAGNPVALTRRSLGPGLWMALGARPFGQGAAPCKPTLADHAGLVAFRAENGVFLEVTAAFAALFSTIPADMIGRDLAEFTTDGLLLGLPIEAWPADQPTVEAEYHAQDTGRTLRLKATRAGGAGAILGHGEDVTALRKLTLDTSRKTRTVASAYNRLEAALDAMTDAFVVYDRDDRLTHCNRAFRTLHGSAGAYVRLGMTHRQILDLCLDHGIFATGDTPRDAFVAEFERTRIESRGRDHLRQFADGRWILRKEIPLPSGDVVGLRVDVTEMKQREIMLLEAQEATEMAQSRLRAALETMDEAIFIYDSEDRLALSNRHGTVLQPKALTGTTFEETLRASIRRGQIQEAIGQEEEWLARRMELHRDPDGPFEVTTRDGTVYRIREYKSDIGDTVVLRSNISEERQRETALKCAWQAAETAQARLDAAIDALPEPLLLFDSAERLVASNDKIRAIGDEVRQALQKGRTYRDILWDLARSGLYPDAEGRIGDWIEQRLARFRSLGEPQEVRFAGGGVYQFSERRTSIGDTVALRVDVSQHRALQRKLATYANDLRQSRDVAEQRNQELERARANLEHNAIHDALTGLGNRRFLDALLTEKIDPAGKDHGVFALMHVDLDHFKGINDTMGHAAGDAVLQHVAEILRSHVGPGDAVARVGGDEFMIVAGLEHDMATLTGLAEALIAAAARPIPFGDQTLTVGLSVGMAEVEPEMTGPRELMINSDIALYRAKSLGRGCWMVFDPRLKAEVEERKRLADELLRAVEGQEFVAVYQPKIDATTGLLSSVEALVRWQHPTRGLVSPAQFLGVASDLGLLARIDSQILDRVVEDRNYWIDAGVDIPQVSINVSGARLRDISLISDIRRAGFPPGTLSVELLESIFLDNADTVVDWALEQFEELGVPVELDDFGTGHSSIVGLINLKPSGIKIDRQFILPMLESNENTALVASIIEIGRSLNVNVTAEGVETAGQAQLLRSLGCDTLQGFFFAPPLTREAMVRYVRNASAEAEKLTAGSKG